MTSSLQHPLKSIRLLDIANIFEQTQGPLPCPFGHDWCGNGAPCTTA